MHKRILYAADVAALLGWSTKRARRWLQREAIASKMGSRWVTTPTKLREAFPEIHDELLQELTDNNDE
jgi:hypothetical protein